VIAINFFSDELHNLKPDIFIVDQLSACVPLLRWLYPRRQRILFYCHFPDQLLADRGTSGIGGLIKLIYRWPFDWFEGWSMAASDKIVVNSKFTKSVAKEVFPTLPDNLAVIYPCVNELQSAPQLEGRLWDNKFRIFLSINRFERKKDVGLAIKAYHGLSESERTSTRLILAGGYDSRVTENVQYHNELVQLAESMGLRTATAKTVPTALGTADDVDVLFLLSVPGTFKNTLLDNAELLLYTPTNEHFGIVPVEAMQHGVPVLASNTGGPLETILEGETGWLRDVNKVEEWTQVMSKGVGMGAKSMKESDREKMKAAGHKRAKEFSRDTMAKNFDDEMTKMAEQSRSHFTGGQDLFMALGLLVCFVGAFIMVVVQAQTKRGSDRRSIRFARARESSASNGDEMNLGAYQIL
jgi:alpha-1,3/alpha-1,6-mannosyltransferase